MFKKHHNQRAFTLIELLVVIFIIGLTLGWITIKNHHKDDINHAVSQALKELVNNFYLAKQQAIVNQKKLVFTHQDNKYQFSFFDSDTVFISHSFDKKLIMSVMTEVPDEKIILYQNGEITSFKITIGNQCIFVSKSGKIKHERNAIQN